MILTGDCLEILPTLDAESVQCCVTSPPYYGLRDYGTATWEGGDSGCDHNMPPLGGSGELSLVSSDANREKKKAYRTQQYHSVCGKCGATRIDSQIGLEPTPEAYVEKLVAVFREVRRVLRDDGTVWLNLGDSYAGSGEGGGGNRKGNEHGQHDTMKGKRPSLNGLKPKDLIGIPWRVAFALQADGWYLRQDIIWSKPNPMPESVTDRCTKAHEYIFLLTKSSRYYYDCDAVREQTGSEMSWEEYQKKTAPGATWESGGITRYAGANKHDGGQSHPNGRNKRSVWTITTKPFKEAHFATFPPEIPEICIKAGSKPGNTILDPFSGAGTTGMVAEKLGRKYVGIELNPSYVSMSEDRIYAEVGGLL